MAVLTYRFSMCKLQWTGVGRMGWETGDQKWELMKQPFAFIVPFLGHTLSRRVFCHLTALKFLDKDETDGPIQTSVGVGDYSSVRISCSAR